VTVGIDYSGLPQAKPEPRKAIKARRRREEKVVIAAVRKAVLERDGRCRVSGGKVLGDCQGPTELAHVGDKRRFKTVNEPPNERHQTAWTVALCRRHHAQYDAHQWDFQTLEDEGMDGDLVGIVRRGWLKDGAWRKPRRG